jgi:hypothetical protein
MTNDGREECPIARGRIWNLENAEGVQDPTASLREALRVGLSPGACRTLNAVSARRAFGN